MADDVLLERQAGGLNRRIGRFPHFRPPNRQSRQLDRYIYAVDCYLQARSFVLIQPTQPIRARPSASEFWFSSKLETAGSLPHPRSFTPD